MSQSRITFAAGVAALGVAGYGNTDLIVSEFLTAGDRLPMHHRRIRLWTCPRGGK